METKILWLSDHLPHQFASDPDEQEVIFSGMLKFARNVARPATDFVIEFVDRSGGQNLWPQARYPSAFMAVEVLQRLRQAESEGFDAAFPGMCFGEFFLQQARQAVKMPVVGPAESSMSIAQLLGKKFAILTVADTFEYVMEENIRFHRWEKAAINYRPVRSWEPAGMGTMMAEAFEGRPGRLIEDFDKRAKELVRDGADVVICGCNPYGAALSYAGYNEVAGTGVPVVTALPSQIKLAESLIDLKRSLGWAKSEAVVGPYRSTPVEVLEDLAAHGISMPATWNGTRKTKKPKFELVE